MPERSSDPRRWRILGRLLPREVRERVFEPAFSDLVYDRLVRRDGRERAPLLLYALATWLQCLPVAIPRLFVSRGRLTRLGRASAWTLAVLALIAFALARLTHSIPGY